ncbi:MAG: hypothetical protein CMJ18_05465 [Phycisphaeraceae bacterium]|nr:hypothetical protein [Phycisphaeraceae bacterium]
MAKRARTASNPFHALSPFESLSIGSWVILLIAVVSSIAAVAWPIERRQGMQLWTFARNHGDLYRRLAVDNNARAKSEGRPGLHVLTIDAPALSRRTLSGFWSQTPLADLIEVERNMMTQFVSGPVEDVGFTDLTERLAREGLDRQINPPSFMPWTSRGRIFGLPHDVHPVLLCYRADLVEQAGIDVTRIETWSDFIELLSPLIADLDGDGRPDRYLINLWYTQMGEIEPLLLQAGGGTFDENDRPLIGSPANAMVIAHVVAWSMGETRIAIDAPEFTASGNQLKLDGRVVAQIMPDWLAGIWKSDLPQLGGKIRLMPLPAWRKGGRRTSVRGGTMIGIPRSTRDFEAAWQAARHLYLSRDLAEELFRSSHIISPVKRYWNEAFYQTPDPYFRGQTTGAAYIEQAPNVPFRSSNPFHNLALTRIGDAINDLHAAAAAGEIVPVEQVTAEALMPRASALLEEAEARVLREMARNVFLRSPAADDPTHRGRR